MPNASQSDSFALTGNQLTDSQNSATPNCRIDATTVTANNQTTTQYKLTVINGIGTCQIVATRNEVEQIDQTISKTITLFKAPLRPITTGLLVLPIKEGTTLITSFAGALTDSSINFSGYQFNDSSTAPVVNIGALLKTFDNNIAGTNHVVTIGGIRIQSTRYRLVDDSGNFNYTQSVYLYGQLVKADVNNGGGGNTNNPPPDDPTKNKPKPTGELPKPDDTTNKNKNKPINTDDPCATLPPELCPFEGYNPTTHKPIVNSGPTSGIPFTPPTDFKPYNLGPFALHYVSYGFVDLIDLASNLIKLNGHKSGSIIITLPAEGSLAQLKDSITATYNYLVEFIGQHYKVVFLRSAYLLNCKQGTKGCKINNWFTYDWSGELNETITQPIPGNAKPRKTLNLTFDPKTGALTKAGNSTLVTALKISNIDYLDKVAIILGKKLAMAEIKSVQNVLVAQKATRINVSAKDVKGKYCQSGSKGCSTIVTFTGGIKKAITISSGSKKK